MFQEGECKSDFLLRTLFLTPENPHPYTPGSNHNLKETYKDYLPNLLALPKALPDVLCILFATS